MLPVLETKLYVPKPRRGVVPRARLRERLDRAADVQLTLVSAPAGFGKTTLLADWLATIKVDGRAVAWLSLDQGDNHPTSFWTYVAAALQKVAPGAGQNAISLLESPQPPPIETVLATLLNDLSNVSIDLVMVLDDYHLVDASELRAGMAFFIDHLPPQLHLVIASRADPALPLARLRVRGELVEVRAADLRFTPDEAAAYFSEVMGLDLQARDVALLEGRTEGWIAALQLAALSMQGRDDLAGFIADFSGDDRYIVDYLVDEGLQRQPDHVRGFLQQTSILDRLNGPLCNAVTGQDNGNAMLEALERGNLFVVPLDDRRKWYRYHHLFADVLHARLLDEQPDNVRELHRRASDWYDENGEPSEAIRHALASENFARAADLLEPAVPALLRTRQEAMLLDWLKALPEDVLRYRPVLSNAYAGALLSTGQPDGVEARLRDAERWLDQTAEEASSAGMVVVDQAEFRRLTGAIAVHRAGHALLSGDVVGTVSHARRALTLVAEADHLRRGSTAALLGLAAWASGDLESAHQSYSAAQASLLRAGFVADAVGCATTLGDLRITQGRLHDAMRTYEEALELTAQQSGPVLRGTADMHVAISQIHYERNNLDAAAQHLRKSQELGEHNGLPKNPYRWRAGMARIREAQGDLDGALRLLDEAARVYTTDFSPSVRPIAAVKVRVWLALGRIGEAVRWTREQGLSPRDHLSYVREFEHITLARVLLANRADVEALELLARLLKAAEDGGRIGSVIEILVLQALGQQSQGDTHAPL